MGLAVRCEAFGSLLRAAGLAFLTLSLAACSGAPEASRSLSFDAHSEKAIVVVGTSANAAQTLRQSGESLSTFWQEYDPLARRLLAKGNIIRTKVFKAPFTPFVGSGRGYLDPTVTVLEVEPGDYALIAAGFPHLMTLFVRSIDGNSQANTYVVDPTKYVDPEAKVDPRRNFVFSVDAGQIAYIGHFEFVKLQYFDKFVSINYSLDQATAQAALKEFPAIRGEITVLNLEEPIVSAQINP
ncbi:MAG: hypothetical protein RH942_18080 [Kiloniellaceae bacterium]